MIFVGNIFLSKKKR